MLRRKWGTYILHVFVITKALTSYIRLPNIYNVSVWLYRGWLIASLFSPSQALPFQIRKTSFVPIILYPSIRMLSWRIGCEERLTKKKKKKHLSRFLRIRGGRIIHVLAVIEANECMPMNARDGTRYSWNWTRTISKFHHGEFPTATRFRTRLSERLERMNESFSDECRNGV